ncbi:hypothetical protein E2562_000163 [Oryza meyeriana var. granulata]|uniref:Uncharacterized protein n=1 Tax=Oryza meyeriana var. granulata TaxID=110450 RepID=A0A6G1DBV0_9ORYZ|nr:hypothetical protein E2562_000163 [Oryza meyeriana var. granulata]
MQTLANLYASGSQAIPGGQAAQTRPTAQSMVNKALKSEANNRRVEANRKRKAAAFQNKQQGGQRFKNATLQTWRPMYLAPRTCPIAPAPTAAIAHPRTTEVRTPTPTIPTPG